MSVYHLQRYVGLKAIEQAGEDGLKLDYAYTAFKPIARKEFENLSDKLFPTNGNNGFIRALQGLMFDEHIKEITEGAYAITNAGKAELERLEHCGVASVNGSRPHERVSVETRQNYLHLKTAAERRENQYEYFVDDMQAYADEIFGEGNHHVNSGLHDRWAAEAMLMKHGYVLHSDDKNDPQISETGRSFMKELEAHVAPAMITPPAPQDAGLTQPTPAT